MRYLAIFWACGGSVLGFMICALLTSSKMADIEDENMKLRAENFNLRQGKTC